MSEITSLPVVDWDDLTGWVTRIGPTRRDQLADALRARRSAEHERIIVETVREVLTREDCRDVLGVVFTPQSWDNGYFLSSTGTVVFADGSIQDLDFGDIDDTFTDEIGVCGPDFALSVNPRTGAVDTDDYADNLYAWLTPRSVGAQAA